MPEFNVIVQKDGRVELFTNEQLETRQDMPDERNLGTFTARDSKEAMRLLATENPAIDLTNNRITVQVGQHPDHDQKRREMHEELMNEAIDNLHIPQGEDPDTYNDDAHIRRGEMQSPEERAAAREDGERAAGDENQQPRNLSERQSRWGNRGKQPGQRSSRNDANTSGAQGAPDSGSANSGQAPPNSQAK